MFVLMCGVETGALYLLPAVYRAITCGYYSLQGDSALQHFLTAVVGMRAYNDVLCFQCLLEC